MREYIVRLKRVGRWRKPVYEIVVASRDSSASSVGYEKIGFYSPLGGAKIFFVNLDRLSFWLFKGAKIASSVGVILGKMAPRSVLLSNTLKNVARLI